MDPETSEEDKDKVYDAGKIAASANASFDSEKNEEIDGPRHTLEVDTKPVDVPPDGGYGWVCVGCCFIMNAHTWGVNSVGPFSITLPSRNILKLSSHMGYS